MTANQRHSTYLLFPCPLGLPQQLNFRLSDIQNFNNYKVGWVKSNISKFELAALSQLKNNENIVLKPADKGSAVVIMDRQDYIWEGLRQLNDPKYYTKLDSPIYKDTVPIIEKIILTLYNKENHQFKTKDLLFRR